MADNFGSGENGTNAYADALARARQIAAKLASGDENSSMKRPFDGGSDCQPDAKKMATSNDHVNAQLQSMAGQSGPSNAAALAAAAASQINAKLGVASAGPAPVVGTAPDVNTMFGGIAFGVGQSEIITVPDRMVGLLIGKGGEQIASIQAETECRIQFAPDSGGAPVRQCTLTGPPAGIMKAKETIQRLVAKIQGGPMDNDNGGSVAMSGSGGTGQIELMVPGGKVGLIIGKGGETIKQLQERAGVKIVVVQDTNTPTSHDKPVRITGDRQSCLRAKDMLLDLLADKDLQVDAGGHHPDYFGGGGGGGKDIMELPVPRNMIGVIIGKGGEMIRKVQEQSGSRIQFKQEDEELGGPTRICTITGTPQTNQTARGIILELVENGLQRGGGGGGSGGMMGGGRGRGRNMDGGGYGGGNEWGPGGGGSRGGFDGSSYLVPADKCGLVIGKGGETIREINRQSGAHCELSREPQMNPHERAFRIQGTQEQVQMAIRLINEKTGQQSMPDGGGYRGPGGPMGGPPQMQANPYGPPNPQGMPQMQPGQMAQPGQMPQGMMPQQPNYGGGAQPWAAQPYQQNPYGQMAPVPAAVVPDPAKQATDANAAAWAAYYAQMYGQTGAPGQQAQPQPAPAQQPVASYNAPAAAPAAGAQPQPTINPSTGQPDYSAAWAEYYRQQGMHQHAQAILQAAQQSGAGAHPAQQ